MLTPELEAKALCPLESKTSSIRRTADQTKVESEPRQTSLGNDRDTTMRPIVTEDKTVVAICF
jgi:hypothetical protein